MDDNVFDAVFWSFFITSMIGCMLKCSSIIYKFKIREINCCGLKIVRDVENEIKLLNTKLDTIINLLHNKETN